MKVSKYISELRYALKQTDLLADAPVEIEYRLKDSFKETDFYKTVYVFSNRRVEKSRNSVLEIDKKIQSVFYVYKVSTGTSTLYGLFDMRERIVQLVLPILLRKK